MSIALWGSRAYTVPKVGTGVWTSGRAISDDPSSGSCPLITTELSCAENRTLPSFRELENSRASPCPWTVCSVSTGHTFLPSFSSSPTTIVRPPLLCPVCPRQAAQIVSSLRRAGPNQGIALASSACVAGCACVFQPLRCVVWALLLEALLFSCHLSLTQRNNSRVLGPAYQGLSACRGFSALSVWSLAPVGS